MTTKFIDEIVRDSFGLWISALFSAVGARNPDLSFRERRDAFFCLLESLLVDGKIKFVAPDADCYVSPSNPHPALSINDTESHWKLSAKDVVSYIKEKWPEDVESENDEALTIYFYEMPAIIWVDEDGRLFAS